MLRIIVQVELGGTYEDVLSLLIEAVRMDDLPAETNCRYTPTVADMIGPVEPSETTVATTDLVKWLGSFPRNNVSPRSEESGERVICRDWK